MSSRKAARPDLAIADVRPTWTPRRGERVRLVTHTRLAQVAHGTATVIDVPRDPHDNTLAVAADSNPNAHPRDDRWLRWPLDQVRPATVQPDTTS